MISESITRESIIEMPSVGIAGATNAGKSTLLNTLLGKQRSIVSDRKKTTRDILTGTLSLKNSQCVIFDCAGLIAQPADIIDELAQTAAVEALKNSTLVLFCVDLSKDDVTQDDQIFGLIKAKTILGVAAKSDTVTPDELTGKLRLLNDTFSIPFTPVSAKENINIESLTEQIDTQLIASADIPHGTSVVALNTRHKALVTDTVKTIEQAVEQLQRQNDEIAAMMLRTAYDQLGSVEQQPVDEKILDHIFSNFCIGK